MNETARGFFADGAFAVPPLPEQERMVEAVLFASRAPLTAREIAERLPQGCDVAEALAALRRRYEGRGVQLARVGEAWAFRTAADLGFLMSREVVETRKLSPRRHRDAGDRRLPPAGDAGGDRGDPRRVGLGRHARPADRARLGASSGGGG